MERTIPQDRQTTKARVRVRQDGGRVVAKFPAKPAAEIRAQLRAEGWQWSSRAGAWWIATH